jgi:hypothetical protein
MTETILTFVIIVGQDILINFITGNDDYYHD